MYNKVWNLCVTCYAAYTYIYVLLNIYFIFTLQQVARRVFKRVTHFIHSNKRKKKLDNLILNQEMS